MSESSRCNVEILVTLKLKALDCMSYHPILLWKFINMNETAVLIEGFNILSIHLNIRFIPSIFSMGFNEKAQLLYVNFIVKRDRVGERTITWGYKRYQLSFHPWIVLN